MIFRDFDIHKINPSEAEGMVKVEHRCFPEGVAETRDNLLIRIATAPEMFLVATLNNGEDKGKVVAYINGIATDENHFSDKYFHDLTLYEHGGKNIFLLGLAVLPEYRGIGLASELMKEYIKLGKDTSKSMLLLTCLKSKIPMYEKLGFINMGLANSDWGGEIWFEMKYVLV